MAVHASKSPSASKRWMACAGSLALTEVYPALNRDGDNTESRRGTAAHALLEHCLNEGCEAKKYKDWIVNPDTGEVLQPTFELKQKAVEPDLYVADLEDMIEPVQETIDYVEDRLTEYGYDYENTAEAVKAGVLRLETKVVILEDRDDCFGTADIQIRAWPEIVEVIDYKNGAGILVDVPDNPQLLCYLLGSTRHEDTYEKYRYTVAQPRHWKGGIHSVDLEYADIQEFKVVLQSKAEIVDAAVKFIYEKSDGTVDNSIRLVDLEGLLIPNTECRWCDLQTICPAAKRKIEELTLTDFSDEPDNIPVPLDEADHLASVLNWKGYITAYLRAAEDRVQDIIAEGENVKGWMMIPKKGTRQWREDLTQNQIIGRIKSRYGIDKEDIMEPERLKSGPKVEKLIRGKETKEEFSDDFLYKPSTGFKLVQDDGINVPMTTAQDDFK